MSIILGIDPGTTTVGYAVVERVGNLVTALDYGVISTTPKAPLAEKLVEISNDLSELLSQYRIDACGIETLLFTTNRKTGISVAGARGAIISQIARKGIPLFEFGPMQVKKGICWNGHAPKIQVQNAVKLLFKLDVIPKPDDAADALAIAYVTSLARGAGISIK